MTEQDNDIEMVPQKLAEEQVKLIIKRLAMLYHYTGEVLVERYGEEQGQELLAEIIRRYGVEVGTSTREKVEALGLTVTAGNFNTGADLPKWGWESDKIVCEDGVERGRIISCPLADYWKEHGSEKLGRIYCKVDEVKFETYNGTRCRHLKNVLDGDDYCLFDIKE
ncbi:MAG: L-2-amino-thiazoline-4-carboxylic acid hydrolase [Bacillota bacterium]|nr:L-2-amino-thiazoline-4-carboxylic acid hydrolase [Bacillota bacterium]MDW7730039.1 L-2-amino-thiazoline-4-carboxylic acid hydrolase [Bacillota bacterium]